MRKVKPKGLVCANCDTKLVGAYCHACGQRAHLHYKVQHLVEEFMEGIAHFDGRVWRTLPLLAFNPGRLSREWMAGKRARYVAPLHLFLFAVFLLFLIPNFTGRHMFEFEESSAADKEASEFTVTNEDGTTTTVNPNDADALKQKLGVPEPVVGLIQITMKVRENPRYYGYRFEALVYKLSFMTVPISALILGLVYAWRPFSLYQHAVVSLYGLGWLALLVAIGSAFPAPVAKMIYVLIAICAPIHMALHLRGAYGSGWIQSILRMGVLSALTLVAFSGFLLCVMFIGLLG